MTSPTDSMAIDPEEVAQVAEGLTKAQREVMLTMEQDPPRHALYHRYQPRSGSLSSVLAMARRGLICRADDGQGWDFYETGGRKAHTGLAVLTPLGLAVRAYLQEQSR